MFPSHDQGGSPVRAAEKLKDGLEKQLKKLDKKTPKLFKKPLQALFKKASNKLGELQFPLSSPFTATEVTTFMSKEDKSDPFSDARSVSDQGDLDLTEANLGDSFVRFRDLRNRDNQYIYFRGFVTGITENINPTFYHTSY